MTPKDIVEVTLIEDENLYLEAKKAYDESTLPIYNHPNNLNVDDEPLMSLKEYTAYREETSAPLRRPYGELLKRPAILFDEGGYVRAMSPYEGWVMHLYGGGVVERFEGLESGEKILSTVGLTKIVREEGVR